MKARSHALACALACATLLLQASALAFCRTTTCDDTVSCNANPQDCCTPDIEGCDTNGLPLSWQSSCVSYAVQADGSKKQDITAEQTGDIVDEALSTWLAVSCNGDALSMSAENYGTVACDAQEYNSKAGNANIWLFRDSDWPYDDGGSPAGLPIRASALAVTTVSFNWKTGAMYDADVEFNSDQIDLTLGDGEIVNDLLSIATHEAGHFLGLDHSSDWEATMTAGYAPGSIAPRSLSPDDEEAICRAYPVARETTGSSCDPARGFSPVCGGAGGCSLSAGSGDPSSAPGAAALLLGAWLLGRARRTRRTV